MCCLQISGRRCAAFARDIRRVLLTFASHPSIVNTRTDTHTHNYPQLSANFHRAPCARTLVAFNVISSRVRARPPRTLYPPVRHRTHRAKNFAGQKPLLPAATRHRAKKCRHRRRARANADVDSAPHRKEIDCTRVHARMSGRACVCTNKAVYYVN